MYSELILFLPFPSAVVIIGFIRETGSIREDQGPIEICTQVQNGIMLERTVVVAFTTADAQGDMSATGKGSIHSPPQFENV